MGTDKTTCEPILAKVDPADPHPALSLLLTGRCRGGQASAEQFLAFAQRHGLSLERFWTARTSPGDDAPLAAALIVAAAGRAGMSFLSPLLRDADVPLAAALLRHTTADEHVGDLALLQTLLEPHQQRERLAYLQAGYQSLAALLYMRRRGQHGAAAPTWPKGLALQTWAEAHRPLFAQAILDSYQDTLDCPGLLGLRHIDDIIAGHMSAGVFDPALWYVLHDQSRPAGVMLLSPHNDGQTMELVYLGLSPAWRGRGLARRLLQQALVDAEQRQLDQIVLAVDEANAPALALYRALRFSPTARKLALIRPVASH